MNILGTKTFWGAVAGAAIHIAFAVSTHDAAKIGEAVGEGVAAVLTVAGLRGAVAKNGTNQ